MNILKLLSEPVTFHKPILESIHKKLANFYLGRDKPAIKALHAKL